MPFADLGGDFIRAEGGAGFKWHHSAVRERGAPKINRYTMDGIQMSVVLTSIATLVKPAPRR